MYSLYPMAFVAGFLMWVLITYLDKDLTAKKSKTIK